MRVAVAVSVLAVAAAVVMVARSDERVVARTGLAGVIEDVGVDCSPLGRDDRGGWGEPANWRCEPVEAGHLVQGGAVAGVGGAIALVVALVARRRRGSGSFKVARGLAAGSLALALPASVFGALALAEARDVEPLSSSPVDELGALGDGVVDGFQVLELRSVRTGIRVEEERWFVVDAGVDEVERRLDDVGWALEPVPEQFGAGWVMARSTAAPEEVELGRYGDAVGADADTGPNARRLLADVPGARDDLAVVHVRPPAYE